MSEGEPILCAAPDGATRTQLRAQGRTVRRGQAELTLLFATSKQNVSLPICNILDEGELAEAAAVKESLTARAERARCVGRGPTFCSLETMSHGIRGKKDKAR